MLSSEEYIHLIEDGAGGFKAQHIRASFVRRIRYSVNLALVGISSPGFVSWAMGYSVEAPSMIV